MNQPKIGNYRWVVCALLFFATSINYLDRQIIGLLKPVLSMEFEWTEMDYSRIVMAFGISYALGYVVFGRIIDKIGTKMGYAFSIVIWSVAAILHAPARSIFSFGAARALLGLGEGGNFPAAIKAAAEWFPKKERALAAGIFNSGANVGAVVAPILVPFLLGIYGWQMAFIVTGSIGFIWLVFWLIYYEIPSKQKRLKQPEFDYIHSDNEAENEQEADKTPVKWLKLLTLRQTWTFAAGKFFTDPIWYFFLFWLPSYFNSTFELNLSKPSWPLVIVYTATTIGGIGGGFLSSWLIKKGWSVFKARKFSMLIFAAAVIPIMGARFAPNIWISVALICLATAAHQGWSANLYTTVSDMFPKKAVSSVVGIGGMAGSIGGTIFPFFIGYILDSAKAAGNIVTGYNLIFGICGFAYVTGWLVMHLLTPRMKPVNL